MQVTIETITPSVAASWLDCQDGRQRSVKREHVQYLVSEILAGSWRSNGDAIRFDQDGRLIDGQHRLHAIKLAGTPVQSVVVRGLQEDTFKTIDLGKKRTPGDLLAGIGFRDGKSRAAIVRGVIQFEDAVRTGTVNVYNRHLPPSDMIHKHEQMSEEIDRAMIWHSRIKKSILKPASLFAGAYVFLSRIDADCAEEWFSQLVSGANLPEHSPALRLRERLQNQERGMGTDEKISLLLTAWSAFVEGRDIYRLQLPITENRLGTKVLKTPRVAVPYKATKPVRRAANGGSK